MKAILDLLRRPATTSAALRKALAELPVSNVNVITELGDRRRTMLIDGTPDAAIDKLDREIAAARRDGERLEAARAELLERITKAEEGERLDALHADGRKAEAEAAAVARELTDNFAGQVEDLLAMLGRLDAAEQAVTLVNQRLQAAGFVDRVPPVEGRFQAHPTLPMVRRLQQFALNPVFA